MTLPVGTLVMVVRDFISGTFGDSMVGCVGEVVMPLGTYEAFLTGRSIGLKCGYVVHIPSRPELDWLFTPEQLIPLTPPGKDEHAEEGLGVGALV